MRAIHLCLLDRFADRGQIVRCAYWQKTDWRQQFCLDILIFSLSSVLCQRSSQISTKWIIPFVKEPEILSNRFLFVILYLKIFSSIYTPSV